MADLPRARPGVRLAPFTSLKVGGPADLFVRATTVAEVEAVCRWIRSGGLAGRWLGGGSNLLVAEAGLAGVAARFVGQALEAPTDEHPFVVGEAGHSLSRLAATLARAGWSGLEWAASVPGTLGGAVTNNAGAFGSSVAECLLWAELVSPELGLVRLTPPELGYGYRTSRLKRGELAGAVVVRAAFRLTRGSPAEARGLVDQFRRRRTATQPRILSAGSVFANPEGDFAGRLIEAAGLKGRRIGGAEISQQHANFIVNPAGATADDVYALIRLAQQTVWDNARRWLTPEIELVGRWTEEQRAALAGPASEPEVP